MGEVNGLDGADGLNGHCGFLGIAGGFGLGGLVVEGGGGAVLVCDSLAVGESGHLGCVAVSVCLDGDCGGLADGVVDSEDDGLTEGVSHGGRAGLLRDCLAASATHCKQGKRHCEGSR